MLKKAILTLVAFLLVGAAVFGAAAAADTSVGLPAPIRADTPCPVTGCVSGRCHGFDNVPEPDGVHEMLCPESGCASVECHAWETLNGRYHQASDASLNVWIIAPVVLVCGLVLAMGRAR